MKKVDYLTKVLRSAQFRLDTTRFLLDKPKFDYQPLPWVGIEDAPIRGAATKARWNSIKNVINTESKSIKDIGCCVGFFCHSAAEEKGLYAIGIDSNSQFIRIADYVRDKCFSLEQETFISAIIDPISVNTLPTTDVTILFSIWHHWVYEYGLAAATEMLIQVWKTTNIDLFFESGEEEVEKEFNLPFGNEAAAVWLVRYLKQNLTGSIVTELGVFDVGKYAHYTLATSGRTVFHVKRI